MTRVLNFKTIIEQDEDGIFVASVPAVPGCHSQGKTYEEALKNIREALKLCLEVAESNRDYAKKITYPTDSKQEKFIGVIDLPVKAKLAF